MVGNIGKKNADRRFFYYQKNQKYGIMPRAHNKRNKYENT
jgi:hypothetical protein